MRIHSRTKQTHNEGIFVILLHLKSTLTHTHTPSEINMTLDLLEYDYVRGRIVLRGSGLTFEWIFYWMAKRVSPDCLRWTVEVF